MASAVPLTPLSDDQSRWLRSWLADFERAWDENRLAAWAGKLPPPGDPLRLPALAGLVEADLRHYWRQGRRVLVESYLKDWPELAVVEAVLASLVEAERQAREQRGWAGDEAEYARRFPYLAGRLGARAAAGPEGGTRVTRSLDGSTFSSGKPGEPAALPEQFGRYRIIKPLGRGGMGSVYLAFDTQLDRPVALKVPHLRPGENPEALARFSREARAAAVVRHPNICPVHDVGEVGGVHFVTMAYIEGQSLADIIAGGRRLSRRAIATLVRKLALALAEAHRLGVIHRDLKPSNVLIDRRGEPIVMDFGLARRVDQEDTRLTQAGALLGTPAYMAPEQIDGDPAGVGPACDIYALGVVLYELLTGRPPFQGSTAAVLAHVLTTPPVPPSALRPGLDAALEGVCVKALAKRPAERFASMEALAAALAQFLKGDSRPASAPELPVVELPPAEVVRPTRPPPLPPSARPVEVVPIARPASPPPAPPARQAAAKKRPAAPPPRAAAPAPAAPRRRRPWGAILLLGALGSLALIVLAGLYGNKLSPGRYALREGRAALEEREYERAIQAFTEALERDPDNGEAYALRGEAYRHVLEFEKADADLTRAIALDQASATTFARRAAVRASLGKDREAWDDCEQALGRPGAPALARAIQGVLYARKGDLDRAADACDKAVASAPDDDEVRAARGAVNLRAKHLDEALEDYGKAVALNPKSCLAYAGRARVYLSKKQGYEKAMADCDAVLGLTPKRAGGHVLRGEALLTGQKYDAAVTEFSEAVRLDPKSPSAYCGRARAYLFRFPKGKKGDAGGAERYEKAVADCDEALRLDPRSVPGHVYRGLARLRQERYADAVQDFTEVLALDPDNTRAYSGRASAYSRLAQAAASVEDRARYEVSARDDRDRLREVVKRRRK